MDPKSPESRPSTGGSGARPAARPGAAGSSGSSGSFKTVGPQTAGRLGAREATGARPAVKPTASSGTSGASLRAAARPRAKSAGPYKVSLPLRAGAAAIDAVVGLVLGLMFILLGLWWLGLFLLAAYLLVRDGLPIAGLEYQSVGKKLVGLHVELEESGQTRIPLQLSLKRNLPAAAGVLLAPLLGFVNGPLALVVALVPAIVELVLVVMDPNGIRLGDKLAGTKVLD